jgi:hypothetical protein
VWRSTAGTTLAYHEVRRDGTGNLAADVDPGGVPVDALMRTIDFALKGSPR